MATDIERSIKGIVYLSIPIIITTYERPEYFAQTIESLLNTSADLEEVYIFDDASENQTKIELLEIAGSSFKVMVREENKGTVLNTIPAIDHVYEHNGSEYIVVVQDDVIFSKNWLKVGIEKLEMMNKRHHMIAYLSLYNRGENKKTVLMAGHPGGVCYIINRKFWTWYRGKYKNRDTDYMVANNDAKSLRDIVDYKLYLRIREGGWKIACVGNSLVQHIGDKSTLHDNCMAYCRVNNFVGKNV